MDRKRLREAIRLARSYQPRKPATVTEKDGTWWVVLNDCQLLDGASIRLVDFMEMHQAQAMAIEINKRIGMELEEMVPHFSDELGSNLLARFNDMALAVARGEQELDQKLTEQMYSADPAHVIKMIGWLGYRKEGSRWTKRQS